MHQLHGLKMTMVQTDRLQLLTSFLWKFVLMQWLRRFFVEKCFTIDARVCKIYNFQLHVMKETMIS